MKIKVIFTGGTISSKPSQSGISTHNNDGVKMELIENYRKNSFDDKTEFIISQPLNILSENMNISGLNKIITELKATDFSEFDGIIITHGTDTQGFTAPIIAKLLCGIKIPVVFVSANYTLSEEKSNGNTNFLHAVKFIKLKKYNGVFVSYKNDNEEVKIHYGERIRQCETLTDKFLSGNDKFFGSFKSEDFIENCPYHKEDNNDLLINKISELNPCVLLLSGHTGFDYSNITPNEKIMAILHSLYHGGTASTENAFNENTSVLDFAKECTKNNIETFIAPIKSDIDNYASTKIMLSAKISPLYDITLECAYGKLLVAFSTSDLALRQLIINTTSKRENVNF